MHDAFKRELQFKFNSIAHWKHKWRSISTLLISIAMTIFAPVIQAADEPLIMGVFPRRNATETAKLFTPMADYLEKKLGREVKLVTSKNFESFWKDVTEQRYDIVHYNQYQYIRSAKTYRVIAHTQEFGKNAVAGILFVRKDSGITQVSQLRGRAVVFGGSKDAMLSYIAPRYLLQQAGLKEADFKTEIAVNPQNALIALYYKQADAAGGGDVALEQPVVKNAINTQELRILAATEPLLFLPWAVKRNMPAKLTQSIQSVMLDIKNSSAGKQVLETAIMTDIRNAEDRDYDPHRKMIATVFGPKGTAN
jgi:phosphonate transport system substrate-binding protein